MKDKFLPIGSIVTYKRIDIMIIGYFPKVIDDKIKEKYKDYVCCVYPFGLDKNSILIKTEQIDRVIFIGFQDNRFVELKNKMREQNV